MSLKDKIKQYPFLKRLTLNFVMHPVKARPNWWIRIFLFLYIDRAKGSTIYRSVRKDLPPINRFKLGRYSVIEDFSCVNNAVGDIIIGNHSRIGLSNTIIGPVIIGNNVNLAQGIVVSGLNHNYKDINTTISAQGVTVSTVCIEDDVWIGANSVITAGITIGKHSVVAAGSIVTKNIPPYSVVGGNPARIIKKYDIDKAIWVKA